MTRLRRHALILGLALLLLATGSAHGLEESRQALSKVICAHDLTLGEDGVLPNDCTWVATERNAMCCSASEQAGFANAGGLVDDERQIMAAVDLLRRIPSPSDADIEREHTNLCRCGTYARIRRAIHRAAREGAVSTWSPDTAGRQAT